MKVKDFALGSVKLSDFIVISDTEEESKIYHCRLDILEQEYAEPNSNFKDIVNLKMIEFETPEPFSLIAGNINGRYFAIGRNSNKVYSWISQEHSEVDENEEETDGTTCNNVLAIK